MDHHTRIQTFACLGACGVLAMACEQPQVKCNVARGDFAATFTLVSGEGACAMLKGEVLSVQAYNARTSKADKRPNYDATSIGIQPSSITALLAAADGVAEPASGDAPYSLGKFSTAEPIDDFCVAPKLSTTRLRLPEIPDEEPDMCTTIEAQPATEIVYAWKNVRVYTTAANYGTQFSADLTYTQDGCTATYRVAAVYPAVSCNAAPPPEAPPDPEADPDAGEDAGASTDAGADAGAIDECPEPPATPESIPDESLCEAMADPTEGRPIGSGLNPDLAIRCDPDLLLCVLDKKPPSLR